MSSGLASGTDLPNARIVKRPPLVRFMRKYPLQIGIFLVAVVIWLIFVIGAPRTFLAGDIYVSFMATTPFFAIMAIPLTMVVITGEIDLSFPSIMAIGMTAFELVFLSTHSTWYAFIACLLGGLIAGALNGVIVVRLGVPSLVATIGTQFFYRGAVMVLTGAKGIGMTETQGTVLYPLLVGRIGGVIPAQFVWTIGIGLLVWFFLNRHRFGAHVYLVGDNLESARLMGVSVGRTKLLTFAVLGTVAAFAGFLQSEEILFFWPTIGSGLLLNLGVRRHGHDLRNVCRRLHHGRHQRRDRGDRLDQLLERCRGGIHHRGVGRPSDAGEQAPHLNEQPGACGIPPQAPGAIASR